MIYNNIKELADYKKQSANAQQAQESKSLSEEELQRIIDNMLILDSIRYPNAKSSTSHAAPSKTW